MGKFAGMTDEEISDALAARDRSLDKLVGGAVLHRIEAARADRDRADVEVAAAVRAAREAGASWQMIGDALGVSRQSAHVKYAELVAGGRRRR